jgi:hypothetical protein
MWMGVSWKAIVHHVGYDKHGYKTQLGILVELLLANPFFTPFNKFKGMVNCIVAGVMYILMGVCKGVQREKEQVHLEVCCGKIELGSA